MKIILNIKQNCSVLVQQNHDQHHHYNHNAVFGAASKQTKEQNDTSSIIVSLLILVQELSLSLLIIVEELSLSLDTSSRIVSLFSFLCSISFFFRGEAPEEEKRVHLEEEEESPKAGKPPRAPGARSPEGPPG